MEFKKNMIHTFFSIIATLLILTSCSKNSSKIVKTKFNEYKVITLNIFEYNIIENKDEYNLPNDLGFDSVFLLDKLRAWGNKKFKVNGEKNSLSLIINGFSLDKKNIKKNKGLKKILFSEEEIEYNLKLKISLKFFDKNKDLDSLNLNGNITFLIKDNYSISQKKDSLISAYMELIKKLDATLNLELEKKAFSKFMAI
ncbi:MAG: hypothetical protein CFH34_00776 [Alphaproteobacteria bacterium MarineAlpha9_Bin4]|nr:hypothetical protein [Pelagibacterales bacterium]PPR26705.1 MAG: hypothetical protein CFH34_00776 [Alphaproteobacteria bacterium MarineAlpha9_Bin4]|tara:strand:- start:2012 stop:2605 length:594 start_codon:yes stop_codon:yes gene_type:complete